MNKKLKNELLNIISGKSEVSFGRIIQTITCYLENGEKTSSISKGEKCFKAKEEERLIKFITSNNLWIYNIDFSQYVSEGAEQKVFLKDSKHVLKLNDSIYYESWKDYLINLLLHNYFFSDTAYNLLGFTKNDDVLFAVLQQNYIAIDNTTNLSLVKAFLANNGFENNRNNDYINQELGIIIEDLHDENVLTKNEILYFIDTVFYLTDNFWK